MKTTRQTFSSYQVLILLLAGVIILLLQIFPWFDLIDRRFLDLHFKIRGIDEPHSDIAIIDIDDESIMKMGAWPWPRKYYVDLLKLIEPHHPKVVFFDLIFAEISDEIQDAEFAEEMKKLNVVLPFYYTTAEDEEFVDINIVMPHLMFQQNAKGIGYVNVTPDKDGHVREVLPSYFGFEHAALMMVRFYTNSEPLLDTKSMMINFPGPYGVFSRISFDDLIEHYEDPSVQEFLKKLDGKILLIGHTAAGSAMDLKPTVYSPLYPGVGLQASILHTLLSHKFIKKVSEPVLYLVFLVYSFSIFNFSRKKSPLRALSINTAFIIFIFILAQFLFQFFGVWLPVFGFIIFAVVSYSTSTLLELIRVRIERELISRELILAARIQKNLLPADIPTISGVSIAAISLPARQVGGDFYDFIPIEGNRWGICVGDVSGKGVPAALFMARAISEFRREADSSPPANVMRRLNQKLIGKSGLFLTLFYLVIDMGQKKFTFSNAGHEPIFFYHKRTQSIALLSTKGGPPLGIDETYVFEEQSEQIEPGDVLILQSDGVREAMNRKKEIFGQERLKDVLLKFASLDAPALLQTIQEQIQEFVVDAPQNDDLTLICIRF